MLDLVVDPVSRKLFDIFGKVRIFNEKERQMVREAYPGRHVFTFIIYCQAYSQLQFICTRFISTSLRIDLT